MESRAESETPKFRSKVKNQELGVWIFINGLMPQVTVRRKILISLINDNLTDLPYFL
jgi:hypothetical protein